MIRTAASRLKEIVWLDTKPVAVFLLPAGAESDVFDQFAEVTGHRYCQIPMQPLSRSRLVNTVKSVSQDGPEGGE